jgi:hypothetical protein
MTPEDGFRLANLLALAGWLALIAGVALRRERLRVLVAWRVVPVLLALAYLALLVGAPRGGAGGGFGTLAAVAALFESRWALLAGWIHYLCFDLMVGDHGRGAAARPAALAAGALPAADLSARAARAARAARTSSADAVE